MSAVEPVLRVKALDKHFGALHVTRALDLDLAPGARHALIGPNGAGKTTLVNLIAGALAPDRGRIELAGRDVSRAAQAARVKQGLVRTFQISQLFAALPVLDNVALAVAEQAGRAGNLWRGPPAAGETVDRALEILDALGLAEVAPDPVAELSYGRQRLVEIAMALALRPRVLLLDEPAAGVPSAQHPLLFEVLESLPGEIAVLIIEHDMDVVFRFAQRISVLVNGAILVEGTPAEIAADARVRSVYLGEDVA